METTAHLIAEIESRYPIGESTVNRFSVTGEPYVVIGDPYNSEIRIDELACQPFIDEKTAVMAAYSSFLRYAEGRTGTLYWRVRPTLECVKHETKEKSRYWVYMRCLISSKPNATSNEIIGASP